MIVYLSKLLPLFAYPLGIITTIFLLALFVRSEQCRKLLIGSGIIILWLCANRWVAFALVRSLEWQYLPLTSYPTADAIVVLGGCTEPLDYPRQTVEINSAGDRVLYALHLFRQGKASFVLMSGGNISWMDNRASSPAREMADLWLSMSGPSDVLQIQDKSQNTNEDALLSSAILKQKGAHRILLVTSAMHMPRSVALFQKYGFEVIPAPTDFTITQSAWGDLLEAAPPTQLIYLLPNVNNLSLTTSALKEYFGLISYQLLGWL